MSEIDSMTMSAPWTRVSLVVHNQPKRLGRKEPNNDHYRFSLSVKVFLSRRGAENPLSFSGRSSASGDGMDGYVHRAELGAIVGLVGAEHGKQSMQQFPHDRHDRLQPSLASSEQV